MLASSPDKKSGLRISLVLVLAVLVGLPGSASLQVLRDCGDLDNAFGPFDYTNLNHVSEKLPIVEKAHFTKDVEVLRGHKKCGGNQCNLANDIDYTLRAFPNHHRALMAMARYHIQGFVQRFGEMRYSAECYFQRAIEFKPKDGSVRIIYGYYLSKSGNAEQALHEFEEAVRLMPESPEAHYNLGLTYVDRGDFQRAREHAQIAYEAGFPLPGLRNQLKRAGQWRDESATKSEER